MPIGFILKYFFYHIDMFHTLALGASDIYFDNFWLSADMVNYQW